MQNDDSVDCNVGAKLAGLLSQICSLIEGDSVLEQWFGDPFLTKAKLFPQVVTFAQESSIPLQFMLKGKTFFSFLPLDVLIRIFSFLDLPSISFVSRVCKHWAKIIDSEVFWHDWSHLHLLTPPPSDKSLLIPFFVSSTRSWKWFVQSKTSHKQSLSEFTGTCCLVTKSETGDSIYEGDFIDGIKMGKGSLRYANGDRFEGDFLNDKIEGVGKYWWASGNRYEGTYIKGERTGSGIYVWSNGDRYEGEFLENRRVGKGLMIWADGERYIGDFINNGEITGKGTFYWNNGTWYEGAFVDSERTGQGSFYWPTGDKYVGSFLNDQRTGRGICCFHNGARYEGEFFNGRRNGFGTLSEKDGWEITGSWKDGDIVTEDSLVFRQGSPFPDFTKMKVFPMLNPRLQEVISQKICTSTIKTNREPYGEYFYKVKHYDSYSEPGDPVCVVCAEHCASKYNWVVEPVPMFLTQDRCHCGESRFWPCFARSKCLDSSSTNDQNNNKNKRPRLEHHNSGASPTPVRPKEEDFSCLTESFESSLTSPASSSSSTSSSCASTTTSMIIHLNTESSSSSFSSSTAMEITDETPPPNIYSSISNCADLQLHNNDNKQELNNADENISALNEPMTIQFEESSVSSMIKHLQQITKKRK